MIYFLPLTHHLFVSRLTKYIYTCWWLVVTHRDGSSVLKDQLSMWTKEELRTVFLIFDSHCSAAPAEIFWTRAASWWWFDVCWASIAARKSAGRTAPAFDCCQFPTMIRVLEWQTLFHTVLFISLLLNHKPWTFGYGWVCWSGTKLDFPPPEERNAAERKHWCTWTLNSNQHSLNVDLSVCLFN